MQEMGFFFFAIGKKKKKIPQKHIVKHKRLLRITKNRHLRLMILVLFCVWEYVRIRFIEIIPGICILTIQGQYPKGPVSKAWGFPSSLTFPKQLSGKESACNAGDLGSIPGSEGSSGEGNGNPFQYPCLKNPMGRGA